jgi:hypothetical protein
MVSGYVRIRMYTHRGGLEWCAKSLTPELMERVARSSNATADVLTDVETKPPAESILQKS